MSEYSSNSSSEELTDNDQGFNPEQVELGLLDDDVLDFEIEPRHLNITERMEHWRNVIDPDTATSLPSAYGLPAAIVEGEDGYIPALNVMMSSSQILNEIGGLNANKSITSDVDGTAVIADLNMFHHIVTARSIEVKYEKIKYKKRSRTVVPGTNPPRSVANYPSLEIGKISYDLGPPLTISLVWKGSISRIDRLRIENELIKKAMRHSRCYRNCTDRSLERTKIAAGNGTFSMRKDSFRCFAKNLQNVLTSMHIFWDCFLLIDGYGNQEVTNDLDLEHYEEIFGNSVNVECARDSEMDIAVNLTVKVPEDAEFEGEKTHCTFLSRDGLEHIEQMLEGNERSMSRYPIMACHHVVNGEVNYRFVDENDQLSGASARINGEYFNIREFKIYSMTRTTYHKGNNKINKELDVASQLLQHFDKEPISKFENYVTKLKSKFSANVKKVAENLQEIGDYSYPLRFEITVDTNDGSKAKRWLENLVNNLQTNHIVLFRSSEVSTYMRLLTRAYSTPVVYGLTKLSNAFEGRILAEELRELILTVSVFNNLLFPFLFTGKTYGPASKLIFNRPRGLNVSLDAHRVIKTFGYPVAVFFNDVGEIAAYYHPIRCRFVEVLEGSLNLDDAMARLIDYAAWKKPQKQCRLDILATRAKAAVIVAANDLSAQATIVVQTLFQTMLISKDRELVDYQLQEQYLEGLFGPNTNITEIDWNLYQCLDHMFSNSRLKSRSVQELPYVKAYITMVEDRMRHVTQPLQVVRREVLRCITTAYAQTESDLIIDIPLNVNAAFWDGRSFNKFSNTDLPPIQNAIGEDLPEDNIYSNYVSPARIAECDLDQRRLQSGRRAESEDPWHVAEIMQCAYVKQLPRDTDNINWKKMRPLMSSVHGRRTNLSIRDYTRQYERSFPMEYRQILTYIRRLGPRSYRDLPDHNDCDNDLESLRDWVDAKRRAIRTGRMFPGRGINLRAEINDEELFRENERAIEDDDDDRNDPPPPPNPLIFARERRWEGIRTVPDFLRALFEVEVPEVQLEGPRIRLNVMTNDMENGSGSDEHADGSSNENEENGNDIFGLLDRINQNQDEDSEDGIWHEGNNQAPSDGDWGFENGRSDEEVPHPRNHIDEEFIMNRDHRLMDGDRDHDDQNPPFVDGDYYDGDMVYDMDYENRAPMIDDGYGEMSLADQAPMNHEILNAPMDQASTMNQDESGMDYGNQAPMLDNNFGDMALENHNENTDLDYDDPPQLNHDGDIAHDNLPPQNDYDDGGMVYDDYGDMSLVDQAPMMNQDEGDVVNDNQAPMMDDDYGDMSLVDQAPMMNQDGGDVVNDNHAPMMDDDYGGMPLVDQAPVDRDIPNPTMDQAPNMNQDEGDAVNIHQPPMIGDDYNLPPQIDDDGIVHDDLPPMMDDDYGYMPVDYEAPPMDQDGGDVDRGDLPPPNHNDNDGIPANVLIGPDEMGAHHLNNANQVHEPIEPVNALLQTLSEELGPLRRFGRNDMRTHISTVVAGDVDQVIQNCVSHGSLVVAPKIAGRGGDPFVIISSRIGTQALLAAERAEIFKKRFGILLTIAGLPENSSHNQASLRRLVIKARRVWLDEVGIEYFRDTGYLRALGPGRYAPVPANEWGNIDVLLDLP